MRLKSFSTLSVQFFASPLIPSLSEFGSLVVWYLANIFLAKRSFSSIYEHFKAKDPDYRIYIDAYQIPEEEEYFREFLNIFHRQAAIDTQKGFVFYYFLNYST